MYKADFQELNYGYFNTLAVNKINNKNLSIFFNTEDAVTFNGVSSITAKFDIETDVALLHKVNKIVPTLTRKGFIDINPDLDLFKKFTQSHFKYIEKNHLDPKLGATTLAIINEDLTSYGKLEDIHPAEIEAHLSRFLSDSQILNRILTLEDLKKPDITFTTRARIEHITTVKDGIVTIESLEWEGAKGKILIADIQATDGIVHIIDKMLGPRKAPFDWGEVKG